MLSPKSKLNVQDSSFYTTIEVLVLGRPFCTTIHMLVLYCTTIGEDEFAVRRSKDLCLLILLPLNK